MRIKRERVPTSAGGQSSSVIFPVAYSRFNLTRKESLPVSPSFRTCLGQQ
jgi:hypothetical protein